MKKIALIVPGQIWSAPFVRIYTRILDELQVDYSIISWNRDGNDEPEGIQYDYRLPLNIGTVAKLKGYCRFASFVKKTIKKEGYDGLIVFCSQSGVFLTSLLKQYKGRYIFDYRDLSLEQNRLFYGRFCKVLKYSYMNVISSPGFRKALPEKFNYIISHNFNISEVEKFMDEPTENEWYVQNPKVLLTIGGIRDYDSNTEVIQNLGNNSDYLLSFVGRGVAAEALKTYCDVHQVKNSMFLGYYPKDKEKEYIKNSTFLNIYYPRRLSHDTALSNRFYNSLIYKRPMLVTKNTTQGDYAEQYGVGIAVENCIGIDEKLNSFLSKDYNEYSNRCNMLLGVFLEEQKRFISEVKNFCEI